MSNLKTKSLIISLILSTKAKGTGRHWDYNPHQFNAMDLVISVNELF